jgi:hypothetical protein
MSRSNSRYGGRLGNQIIRHLSLNFIAKKHDLYTSYFRESEISDIGIELFCGRKIYTDTLQLTDWNFFDILDKESINYNLDADSYFQSKKITDKIHEYLNSSEVSEKIIQKNKYKSRYNNNNDCFIHIRLGDVAKWNPGFEYYDEILSTLKIDNIYIATDSADDELIKKLQQKYSNVKIFEDTLSNIIKFGSTNKYVILSYGTFSAVIGYLSYHSTVFYKKVSNKTAWDWDCFPGNGEGFDMFRNHSTKVGPWIEIP